MFNSLLKYASLLLAVSVFLMSCAGSERLSESQLAEISERDFSVQKNEVFQAALMALNDNGFIVRSSNPSAGIIEAEFITRARSDDANFFGYNSRRSTAVQATLSLNEAIAGRTTVKLDLQEVLPPMAPNQYTPVSTESTTRPLREVRYYEGLFREIERIILM